MLPAHKMHKDNRKQWSLNSDNLLIAGEGLHKLLVQSCNCTYSTPRYGADAFVITIHQTPYEQAEQDPVR